MIDIPGNWELAKALAPQDQTKWRNEEEWRQANAKVAQLRAEGHTVELTAGLGGRPVITVTSLGGAA